MQMLNVKNSGIEGMLLELMKVDLGVVAQRIGPVIITEKKMSCP